MTGVVLLAAVLVVQSPSGTWTGELDLAGGSLPFTMHFDSTAGPPSGTLCNAGSCGAFSAVVVSADSVRLELGDYAAAIDAGWRGDSLVGFYHNVGNRGPRVIPFRAAPGARTRTATPTWLVGSWDATFDAAGRLSPRILLFSDGELGMQGAMLSNTGDYGVFSGHAERDSFQLAHFDGSFVFMLTGRRSGDSLIGIFHAGAATQTPFTAVRSTGRPHLREPTAMTRADTSRPFQFDFPSIDGGRVTNRDPRFRDKVVLVDIFGTWCPTCHDAAPVLVELWNRYHDDGLEIVGVAYEVSGDSATDNALIRRYREKFGIPFQLLRGGINLVDATAATLPMLDGFTSYPTTVFLGRDGRVRRVHAGFYGPVTGKHHTQQVAAFHDFIEQLLDE